MKLITCGNVPRLMELETDFCIIELLQLTSTSIISGILLALAALVYLKFHKRSYRRLLTLHNLRSSIVVLLLIINTLELARACLPVIQPPLLAANQHQSQFHSNGFLEKKNCGNGSERNNCADCLLDSWNNSSGLILISGPQTIWNASLAIVLTVVLITFYRIMEVTSAIDFLYVSSAVTVYISFVRFYKLTEFTFEYSSIFELEAFIQNSSGLCLFCLGITDGYTIYRERLKPIVDEKENKDKVFGYRHSISTFYSKVIFWWLTPLLWKGYKKPLEQEDLGYMREEDTARAFYDRFLIIYKAASLLGEHPSLWLCYLKSNWKMFILGGLLKLLGDLFALGGPVSIHLIVAYTEWIYQPMEKKTLLAQNMCNRTLHQMGNQMHSPVYDFSSSLLTDNIKIYHHTWTDLLSNGWVISWLVFVASLAQGALSQSSTHILNMSGIRIKTSLQGLIYRKTLLLSSSCSGCTQTIAENSVESVGNDNQKNIGGELTSGNQSNDVKINPIGNLSDVGAITNLMSEDTLNIMSFFWIAHYVWAIPLKIAVVMYLLYTRLGVSAIIGSFVCILTMTPLQFLIGKAMSNNSEKVSKCTDERLKRIHDVLWGIKLIKLNAWEKVFAEKITCARSMELKYLNKDSFYWTLMAFLTHVSSVLIAFVTLAVYVTMESGAAAKTSEKSPNYTSFDEIKGGFVFPMGLTASCLFSALALFNQLTVPLLIFPITVPIIISAIVSTRRIEKFLREREVQKEFEGIRHMARIFSRSDASLDMYEDETTTVGAKGAPLHPPSAIVVLDATSQNQPLLSSPTLSPRSSLQPSSSLTISTENSIKSENNKNNIADVKIVEIDFPSVREDLQNVRRASHDKVDGSNDCHMFPRKRKDLIRNSRIERVKSKHLKFSSTSLQFQAPENLAVSINKAVFSWDSCNTVLRIDGLAIPKGRLTVVVGKNSSGKSSLLLALLMEIQQVSGEILWNKYSTIAYVPQVPWLLNASIRENILFGETFRPKRYEVVLESCALIPDIELMPDGDMTIIGERGMNLSGGQRQRVAIARSLYSSANVIIMDDPLSSLDNEVARHVFEKSILKMLLKANRTVILVTQRLQLVQNADYLVAMKNGCVQAVGSYQEIEKKYPEVVNRWRSIITSEEKEKEKISPGRTARERWKLFKNVTKASLQRPQSAIGNEIISSSVALAHYNQPKKRPSVYGSRHLIYDMPNPIDECQNDDVIIRHRSAGMSMTNERRRAAHSLELKRIGSLHKKEILRVHSLQPDSRGHVSERQPVMTNIPPPAMFSESAHRRSSCSGSAAEMDLKLSKTGFQQFLHRMSSRKSNKPTSAVRIHRPVSATNSIISISEEGHSSVDGTAETSSYVWIEDERQSSIQELNTESLSGASITGDKRILTQDEERQYGEISPKIYILYLKSAGFPITLLFFISALVWQCLRVYTDVWLQRSTEMPQQAATESSFSEHEITYYFRSYAIISGMCILMALISTPAGQMAGCNARRLLHDKLLQSILSKTLHFFQITPLGRIMNRFTNDMSVIDKKIAATSQRLLQFTLLCFCAILINVSVTPWFALLTIPICGAYYFIQKFYRCSSRELQRIENITNSPIISHFSETIQGVVTIRAYSQEARFTEILFNHLEANTIAFTMLNTSNRWLGISLDYLGAVIVFVAMVTALLAATISSRTSANNSDEAFNKEVRAQGPSPSLVGLAINYTLLVPIYLNWVVKLLADMEMYVGSVERVAHYAEPQQDLDGRTSGISFAKETHAISSSKRCSYEIIYKSVPISWPQKGDIIFENVSLRYEGQEDNVISDLSLKIDAGQKVGICGRTGSGKSSLALSLFGVLEITSGRILIDDVDITQIHPDEIRSRLSIIPQDVHLFHASIRENLDPRGHYSTSDLWKCLELAQLKDVILNAMPLGLDTEINDDGKYFSAGHRQLFCLARAILRGSVCLVLDEATSSLDTTTERSLLDAAHKAFQGRTILTIAHRLSTIMDYDRIIVLENGRIIEDGTPKDLQANTAGHFYALLNSANMSQTSHEN